MWISFNLFPDLASSTTSCSETVGVKQAMPPPNATPAPTGSPPLYPKLRIFGRSCLQFSFARSLESETTRPASGHFGFVVLRLSQSIPFVNMFLPSVAQPD